MSTREQSVGEHVNRTIPGSTLAPGSSTHTSTDIIIHSRNTTQRARLTQKTPPPANPTRPLPLLERLPAQTNNFSAT